MSQLQRRIDERRAVTRKATQQIRDDVRNDVSIEASFVTFMSALGLLCVDGTPHRQQARRIPRAHRS